MKPFFLLGIVFFMLFLIFYLGYFHNMDLAMNYYHLKQFYDIPGDIYEESISGKEIGGLLEQHSNANKMFYISIMLIILSFIMFLFGSTSNHELELSKQIQKKKSRL